VSAAWVGVIVASGTFVLGVLGGFLIGWGRACERLDDLGRRFQNVEAALGLAQGNGASFVRRSECGIVTRGVTDAISALGLRFGAVEERVGDVEQRLAELAGRIH